MLETDRYRRWPEMIMAASCLTFGKSWVSMVGQNLDAHCFSVRPSSSWLLPGDSGPGQLALAPWFRWIYFLPLPCCAEKEAEPCLQMVTSRSPHIPLLHGSSNTFVTNPDEKLCPLDSYPSWLTPMPKDFEAHICFWKNLYPVSVYSKWKKLYILSCSRRILISGSKELPVFARSGCVSRPCDFLA